MRARKLGAVARRAAIAPVVLIACASVALGAARHVTRADATAVADSLSLRHGDVPGFTQVGVQGPPSALERRLSAGFAACYGGPPYSSVLADRQSPGFQASDASRTLVITDTEIFPSAAVAARDLAAAAGKRGQGCALTFGRAAVTPPKGTRITATLTSIASHDRGTGASIAVRLTLTEVPTSKGGPASRVVATQDELSFVRGQAEISFDLGTSSAAPPSAALERRLASLLVARARSVLG